MFVCDAAAAPFDACWLHSARLQRCTVLVCDPALLSLQLWRGFSAVRARGTVLVCNAALNSLSTLPRLLCDVCSLHCARRRCWGRTTASSEPR
eukprot:364169-Chlamydomonas_euryale.AAC.10